MATLKQIQELQIKSGTDIRTCNTYLTKANNNVQVALSMILNDKKNGLLK